MYDFLPLVGTALIMLGFLSIFAYSLLNSGTQVGSGKGAANSSIQGGGVIFIGPIPIIFGTSSQMAVVAGAIGLILLILAIVFFYLLPAK